MKTDVLELAGLTARIIGPADAALTVVLLHGFGAPGDDLVALAQFMPIPGARFVFPEAPIELGGLYGDARAWWHLDLAQLEEALRTGAIRDRRAEVPDGLAPAREQLLRLLDQLVARFAIDPGRLVLGGFSQGAMLSLDVALHRDVAPAGLVLMSGTLLAESVWAPRLSRLASVPVLQSHGRRDALLPYAIAELLRDQLVAAGAAVDFIDFIGGHEIPPAVLDGAATLLRGLLPDQK